MKMYKVLLVALVLVGCSTKQNPMQGENPKVQHPIVKPPDSKPGPPVPSGNLLIDLSVVPVFQENVEAQFTVSVRSLLPDFSQTLVVIDNLADFPGATFDENGNFKWTPPSGTTGSIAQKNLVMRVRALASSATDKSAASLTKEQDVNITVIKIPNAPLITQVADLPQFLREDDSEVFHVLVKDPDGGVSTPTLQFLAPDDDSVKSLSSFVSVTDSQYDAGTQLWTYTCKLNLNSELTDSSHNYGFSVQALTHFGRTSPTLNYTVKVYTTLDNPSSSWPEGESIKPGVESRIPFIIYNAKGEGQLTITNSVLPGTGEILCDSMTALGLLSCTFVYTPAKQGMSARDEQLKITVETTNTDTSDILKVDTVKTFDLHVEAP